MKKYIISIFTAILGIFIASNAIASTNITLIPTTRNIVEGQSFDLIVYANANGVRNGAVEVKIKFPADLLRITSFNQPEAWLLVKQAGDLEDNINGILLKSSIYTGGFTSDVVFGTVTFTAKKTGVAIVSVASDCAAYDVSSKNVYSGNSQSVINITNKTSINTTVDNLSTTTAEDQGFDTLEVSDTDDSSGILGTSTNNNLISSVFGYMMSGKQLSWIIGAIIILGIFIWILFFIKKRKDEDDKDNINNQNQ